MQLFFFRNKARGEDRKLLLLSVLINPKIQKSVAKVVVKRVLPGKHIDFFRKKKKTGKEEKVGREGKRKKKSMNE